MFQVQQGSAIGTVRAAVEARSASRLCVFSSVMSAKVYLTASQGFVPALRRESGGRFSEAGVAA